MQLRCACVEGESGAREARLRRPPAAERGAGTRLLARPRARAPGRGRTHLCAGSSAPDASLWGTPPRPTAPGVLAAVAAAQPPSGIPVATPVGAARLQGRVRPIRAARSRTARLPRVWGQREWQGWECPGQGQAGGTREAPKLWARDLEGCPTRLLVPFGCFLLTLPGECPGRKWCQVESALLLVVLGLW